MIITKEYLLENKTANGAWTKSQIEALGLTWPPRKGWISQIIDTSISDEMKAQFEKKERAKPDRKADQMLQSIYTNRQNLSDKILSRAIKLLTEERDRRLK